MVVEGASRQAYSLGCLVVVYKPLNLQHNKQENPCLSTIDYGGSLVDG